MDVLRVSDDEFRRIYERAYQLWSGLQRNAIARISLKTASFSIEDIFHQQPSFPPNLRLQHVSDGHSKVYATGTSTWGASSAECEHILATFQTPVRMEVATQKPLSLFVHNCRPNANELVYKSSSFNKTDTHLSLLVLAWAYIFSARWVELVPGQCALEYTDNQAPFICSSPRQVHSTYVSVDIGQASPAEVRWWTAILSGKGGWRASMSIDEEIFVSPWSLDPKMEKPYLVSCTIETAPDCVDAQTPTSFKDACEFLDRYCFLHGITRHRHTALGSLVVMPALVDNDGFHLHDSGSSKLLHTCFTEHLTANNAVAAPCDRQYIDRLLTLSCHTKGIQPLISSVFYEPEIECNAVTPWLQGTMAAIDILTVKDSYALIGMLVERRPDLAFLWMGCIVLGLETRVLEDVRRGNLHFDLDAGAWSGTIQSFLQQPICYPLVGNEQVTRADECRLLYLSQAEHHRGMLHCQWKPFGTTPLIDTDVEVQMHAKCQGHALQYRSFAWDCTDTAGGKIEVLDKPRGFDYTQTSNAGVPSCLYPLPVSYHYLDRNQEGASRAATSMVFRWLRGERCTAHESNTGTHKCFCVRLRERERENAAHSSRQASQSVSPFDAWFGHIAMATAHWSGDH